MSPLLEVRELSVAFGTGKNKNYAVKSASFDVKKGETFGIVGESGSGKTTIGRSVMRLYPPESGEILYNGSRISGKIPVSEDRALTKKIQMIFQDPMSSLNERAKVHNIISEGLVNFSALPKAEVANRVAKALRDVGLPASFASRYPHEFSGGQRQRIGIARAIIMQPELIVADEPISALDVSIRAQVLNLMGKLKKEYALTYVFISHDLSVMRLFCDRIASMYKGRIVELADTQTLFENPMHPYTRSLLSAVPNPDPDVQRAKEYIAYDPLEHDYSKDQPSFIEASPGHYIYANEEEALRYKKRMRK